MFCKVREYYADRLYPASGDDGTDVFTGCVQQLQAVIALRAPQKNATLADVAQVVQTAQLDFGTEAELEDVIQQLVVRDLERQLHERSRRTTIQGS